MASTILKNINLKSSRQLLIWSWDTSKNYRLQAVLNTLIGILLVATDLLFVWATKLAVDIATHVNTHHSLNFAISLLVAIVVIQILLRIASRWVRALLGVEAFNKMQLSLFSGLLGAQWRELRRFHSADLINRIEHDARQVVAFLTENLPALITTCMQFLGAFLFLFFMDRTLALIIIFVLPFFVICSKLYMRRMRKLTHTIRTTESNIQSVVQESLQHALVLKALEQTTGAAEKLHNRQKELHESVITKTKYSTVSSTLMNIGFAAGYLVTFSWGAMSLEQGLITYGTLIAFIQLVGQIQAPLRSLTQFVPIFISTATAGERLMELQSVIPEAPTTPSKRIEGAGLRISQLEFAYTPQSRHIFRDFSHTFLPGSITAITGETGAGKTTLIRLLLALFSPVSGRIEVYGENKAYPVSPATRTNFSYVPQGNTLLSGTVRQNLLLGNPQATEADMERALHAACADFVFNLPQRLDAPCGEQGDGFSEGQAQRIAIARCLLRPAPIHLFDEATSALDEATERTVISRIVEMLPGRTLIFITHRPAVLEYCTHSLHLKKNRTN